MPRPHVTGGQELLNSKIKKERGAVMKNFFSKIKKPLIIVILGVRKVAFSSIFSINTSFITLVLSAFLAISNTIVCGTSSCQVMTKRHAPAISTLTFVKFVKYPFLLSISIDKIIIVTSIT